MEISHAHNWTIEYVKSLTVDKLLAYHLFITRDRQASMGQSFGGYAPSMPEQPTGKPKVKEERLSANMTKKTMSFSLQDMLKNPNIENEIKP